MSYSAPIEPSDSFHALNCIDEITSIISLSGFGRNLILSLFS